MMFMKKPILSMEELNIIRTFMKSKKITFKAVSKEMDYSVSHVINVFRGLYGAHRKFVNSLLKALQRILEKDITEFYELMGEHSWPTLTGE